MSLYIVDIHGDIEGDYEIVRKYKEQKPALDKIRAEIEDWQKDIHDNEQDAEKYDFVFEPIYAIIDKYKAESEKTDADSN